jgi:streptogramin lyase
MKAALTSKCNDLAPDVEGANAKGTYGDDDRISAWVIRALCLAFVLSFLPRSGAPVDAAPGALPTLQEETRPSYRLVDTMGHARARAEAGRFERATDLASAPDGTTYVIDYQAGVMHVFDANEQPVDLVSLSPRYSASSVDVGDDGSVFLLYKLAVERRDKDGKLLEAFDIRPPNSYRYGDIAAAPDGGFYLSRISKVRFLTCTENGLGTNPPIYEGTGIDRYDAQGRWQETIGIEYLALAYALDVAVDGTLYVANRIQTPRVCSGPGGPAPPPWPTATVRPSAVRVPHPGASSAPDGLSNEANGRLATESLVLFSGASGYPYARRLSGGYSDVAAGNAAVFATQGGTLVREVTGGQRGIIKDSDESYLAADVRTDGRVQLLARSCYRQAVMTWDPELDRVGGYGMSNGRYGYVSPYDYPLEGPIMPIRLEAGDSLAVLQGAFIKWNGATLTQHEFSNDSRSIVQRWPLYGEVGAEPGPRAQMGSCTQEGLNGYRCPATDIAIDEENLYTLHPTRVELRPDGQLPARTWEFRGRLNKDGRVAYLSAISAHGGSLAMLNVGFGEVELWEWDGRDRFVWKYDDDPRNGLPVDIAVSSPQAPGGSKVFLADRGRNRIRVYDPHVGRPEEGKTQLEWPVHDGPIAMDTGPEGDVFVLGRGGWGLRYGSEGRLKAYWRMPDLEVSPRDIAVDASGKVYVSFVKLSAEHSATEAARNIEDGGIWVFASDDVTSTDSPLPEVGACLGHPNKFAAPARIPLGESVEVGLTVDGTCPGEHEPVQSAVVFDTSYSMTYEWSMHRAQRALVAMIEELDPYIAEMARISFGDGAALRKLSSDSWKRTSTTVRNTHGLVVVRGSRESGCLGGAILLAQL